MAVPWFPVSQQQVSEVTGRRTEVSNDGPCSAEYQPTSAVCPGKPQVVLYITNKIVCTHDQRSSAITGQRPDSGMIYKDVYYV